MSYDKRGTIDLNADLGEGCGWDEPLLGLVTSAAISCGAHAGHPDEILRTLSIAADRGVAIGAHPGYPDREHFGRRPREIDADGARSLVLDQVETLAALAFRAGPPLRFLKPHGALYNQAQDDDAVAAGVVAAAKELELPILGLPGAAVERQAVEQGVRFIAEGFADRRYRPGGRLVPRGEPGAIIDDPTLMSLQVIELVEGRRVQTLCLHGDDPGAVALAGRVRGILERQAIEPRAFASWA
ncbi:5-oxoprolinase subunit PxpA [Tundrisphaera sp. TA3]|uniref:5-oxoprolinase subunit PxpA n=1 Tax=Tundrisphaera sp. TA3 TaxID=3435775 RepID=UPI003EB7589E